MKLSKNIFVFFVVIICILTNFTKTNTFAIEDIYYNPRKISHVAVLSLTFDNFFVKQLTDSMINLQDQYKDKIDYTFYNLKNNISSQNEALDSILKSNFDLIIALLPDSTEATVKDIILKVKTKNIPIIFVDIAPQIVNNVSRYYNKVAFLLENTEEVGAMQGKMIADEWNSNKKRMDKNGDGILQYILIKAINLKAVSDERARFSISAINKSGIPTEELQLLNIDWLKYNSKIGIENAFLKYDGSIEAIISIDDTMAIGAIEGLQKYGYNTGDKSKYIPIFGISGVPEAKELIDRGFMDATVILDPNEAAEIAYIVGMNLINNLDPIENTTYKLVNGEIMVYDNPPVYTKKINATSSPQ